MNIIPASETSIVPLNCIGIPAVMVDQNGRIVSWNLYAEDFFQLPSERALGNEWHTVVRSTKTPGCCVFCRTRRALRRGDVAHPVDTTLAVGGRHQRVMLIPVPTSTDLDGDISFLVINQSAGRVADTVPVAPIPMNSRVRQLANDRMIDELTMRERDILACVVDGLDARSIASRLGISHATARNYVQRILTKLGVRNKAEAVSIALTYNLLAS